MQDAHSYASFGEISKQVHYLRDIILKDIECGFERPSVVDREVLFSHHKQVTKRWFLRVSSSNKKRFVMVLLRDVHSAWTLSLLLKSIWNCRPKDAVPSPYEAWSSYDQVPMDHNRTAIPLDMLVGVMELERKWFRTLEPDEQAEFLLALLKCAGGPIMWAVLHKAQAIFEHYRDIQLENIQECMAVVETQEKIAPIADDKSKKESHRKPSANNGEATAQADSAQRELEMYLAQWNATIKSMKDSQKLEEIELSFNDGTKKRMWKVNRPKPEVTETVDYFQLLPLSVAKQILNYVPRAQLNDCARVNRYWAYVVEEFNAELAARRKIDMDIQRLTELMEAHDLRDNSTSSFHTTGAVSYTMPVSMSRRRGPASVRSERSREPQRFSQKSATASEFKRILRESNTRKRPKPPPVRNLAELSERLDQRGAADDNLWVWCKRVLEMYNIPDLGKVTLPHISDKSSLPNGVMAFGDIHFPSPLMSKSLKVPLKPALCTDFTKDTMRKKAKPSNINSTEMAKLTKKGRKFYNLWSRDLSSLYTAYKIPDYKSPV